MGPRVQNYSCRGPGCPPGAGTWHQGGQRGKVGGQASRRSGHVPHDTSPLPALAALVRKLRPREGKLSARLLTSPAAEVGAENRKILLFPTQPFPNQLGGQAIPPFPELQLSSPHALPACLLGTPMEGLISRWFAEAKHHINTEGY